MKPRILIVEDERAIQIALTGLLRRDDYEVDVAGSGEEALNMLTATTPSLVLLDVLLPEMNGFTTFEKIRERSQVPIIFVSTGDRDEDMARGLDLGADDFIAKPFSTNELTTRVKAVLRRTSSKPPFAAEARTTRFEPDMSFLDEPAKRAEKISDAQPPIPPVHSRVNSVDGLVSKKGASSADPVPSAAEENYEGAVKLIVETQGEIKNLVKFVGSLRENPQFHLLRVVSNSRRDGMDVWLRLRGPNPLRTTLMAGGGVSQVEASEDSELDPESGVEMPILRVSLG